VLAQEESGAAIEELFGGWIHERDLLLRTDDQQWHGQCARDEAG
jgi:hypothetical protein